MTELLKQMLYPGRIKQSFDARLGKASSANLIAEILKKNAGIFRKKEKLHKKIISERLGWIDVLGEMKEQISRLEEFARAVKDDGLKHFLLMGMGGSAQGPEVFNKVFGPAAWLKSFDVVDTTEPTTVAALSKRVDFRKTFAVISSKSGETIETLSLYRYFFRQIKDLRPLKAGSNFGAISDGETEIERIARRNRFREFFANRSDIGGRYSALSYFGLVPAAFTRANLSKLVGGAIQLLADISANPTKNDALELGVFMAAAAMDKMDKIHIMATPELVPMIPWLEQLIAESLGKDNKGLIPVNANGGDKCSSDSDDRFYVYLGLKGKKLPAYVQTLSRSRTPAIIVELKDKDAIGAEMFKWQMATTVAAAILGLNPFDEPNVAESKKNTLAVLDAKKGRKKIIPDPPLCSLDGFVFEFDTDLPGIDRRRSTSGTEVAQEFLKGIKKGDYVSLMAYTSENNESNKRLAKLRDIIEAHGCVTVTSGYGPRYLHSAGQLHKGGIQNGHFVVLEEVCPDELDIPKLNISFNRLFAAQAEGDIRALRKRKRPVLHVKFTGDITRGFDRFAELMKSA